MLRSVFCIMAAIPLVMGTVPHAAGAAETLGQVPADALGFVVLPSLDSTVGKLGPVAKALGLPVPPALAEGKRLPGLSETESTVAVALVAGPEKDSKPVPIGIVPVKDFAEFTKALGAEAKAGVAEIGFPLGKIVAKERAGYALLVPADNEEVLDTALGKPGSILDQVSQDLPWIKGRDIAVVITDKGLTLLCNKLVEGITIAQKAIKEKGEDELDVTEILGVYKKVFAAVDREVELAAVGFDVQPSGDLRLRVRKRFVPTGKIAACLKPVEPAPDLLAGMPDVPFVAVGGGVFNRATADLMMEFSVEVMKAGRKLYGISDEQAARMLDLAGPMLGRIQSMSMMLAVGEADDSLYSRMVAVIGTDSSQQYMRDYQKYLEEFTAIMKGSKGLFAIKMQSSPTEVDGRKGVKISMDFPKEWMEKLPSGQAMLEKMIGPGARIQAFIVPGSDRQVALGYTDTRLVGKSLAVFEGKAAGLSASKSVAQAAAVLGKGNFGVGYVSPAGLVAFVNSMIRVAAPEGKKDVQLPAFPPSPPIAWSLNAEGAVFEAELLVPADTIKAILGYGPQVQKALAPKAL